MILICIDNYCSRSWHSFLNGSKRCYRLSRSIIRWWRIVQTEKVLSMSCSVWEFFCWKLSVWLHIWDFIAGFDRHLLGLLLIAKEEGLPIPELFEDPLFSRRYLGQWLLCASYGSPWILEGMQHLPLIFPLCHTVEEAEISFSQQVWLVTCESRELWLPWYTMDTDFSTISETTGESTPLYSSGRVGTVTHLWFEHLSALWFHSCCLPFATGLATSPPGYLTRVDVSLLCFWDPFKITLWGLLCRMVFQDIIVTLSSSVKPVHFKNIPDLCKILFWQVKIYKYMWLFICVGLHVQTEIRLGHFRRDAENSVIVHRTLVFQFRVIQSHTFPSENFITCFAFAWFVRSYTSVTCHCWPRRPWIVCVH